MQNPKEGFINRATLHLARGELKEVEQISREQLNGGFHWEFAHLLGAALSRQGKLEEGFQWLQRALEAKSDSARLWLELGLCLQQGKRVRNALACFQKSVALEPNLAEAARELARTCHQLAAFAEAQRWYVHALKHDPSLPGVSAGMEAVRMSIEQIPLVAQDWTTRSRSGAGVEGNPARNLERREVLPYLLNELGLVGTGVEIGVQHGFFSEQLLSFWKGRRLYSIDPWREFSNDNYQDSANVQQDQQNEFYKGTIRRLMPFEARSVIWRLTSVEAADLLEEATLDFCYIDGDHSYSGLARDLELWFPKIKPGGILGGHDYIPDGSYNFGVFGVQKAVGEFVKAHGLRTFFSGEPQFEFPSWFVINHR